MAFLAAVYVVDQAAPGAADTGPGSQEKPFKTVQHAADVARPGDIIYVMAGKYDERIKVKTSGADLIEGWKREADGTWSAPLTTEPKKVLRDSQPWSEISYDKAAKRIIVKTGGDPRLHVFETVVREQVIDLAGKKDVKVEDIMVANTSKEVR